MRRFADANGRAATGAERKILKELAERFDLSARESGHTELNSGWAWVSAAIYEAVDSGSAYVAPKRIREILLRWERDGLPSNEPAAPTPQPEPRKQAPRTRAKNDKPEPFAPTAPGVVQDVPVLRSDDANLFPENDDEPFAPPVFDLGNGLTSTQVWPAALALLRQSGVPAGDVDHWLRPLILLGLDVDGERDRLILGAPNRATLLRGERYTTQIEGVLSALLGRSMGVSLTLTHDWPNERSAAS